MERVSECIKIILRETLLNDSQKISKAVSAFESCKIISSDDYEMIEKQICSGKIDDALESIEACINKNSKLNKKHFQKLSKSEGFPCDSDAKKLIVDLVTKGVTNGVLWLFQSWKALLKNRKIVLQFAGEKWPGYNWTKCTEEYHSWPFVVISHCVGNSETDRTDVYLEELKETITRISLEQMDKLHSSTVVKVDAAGNIPTLPAFDGDSELRKSVVFIFRRYLEEDEKEVISFLEVLSFRGLISAVMKEKIANMFSVEESNLDVLAEMMMQTIVEYSPTSWKDKLAALIDTESSSCKEILSILNLITTSGLSNSDLYQLFYSWDRMKNLKEALAFFITASWSVEHRYLLGKWPWRMMEKAIQTSNDARVKVLLERIDKSPREKQRTSQSNRAENIGNNNSDPNDKNRKDEEYDGEKQRLSDANKIIAWMDESHFDLERIEGANLLLLQNEWPQYAGLLKEKKWTDLTFSLQNDTTQNVKKFSKQLISCFKETKSMTESAPVPAERSHHLVEDSKQDMTRQKSIQKTEQENLMSMKEWIKKFHLEIAERYDDLKDIAALTWPGNTSIIKKDDWPFLLMNKCIMETSPSVLNQFISSAQRVLSQATLTSKAQIFDAVEEHQTFPHYIEKGTEKILQEPREWLEESFSMLEESFEVVKDLVSSVWPQEPDLTDEVEWLYSLTAKFEDPTQAKSVQSFIEKVDGRQHKSDEEEETIAEQRRKENCKWMASQGFKLMRKMPENTKKMIMQTWPNENELVSGTWTLNIVTKCKKGPAKEVNEFIESLHSAFIEKSADEPTGSPLQKPQPPTLPAKRTTPPAETNVQSVQLKTQQEQQSSNQHADNVENKLREENIKWMKASFSILKEESETVKPFILQTWPGDARLAGQSWSLELLKKCESEDAKIINTLIAGLKDLLDKQLKKSYKGKKINEGEKAFGAAIEKQTSANPDNQIQKDILWISQLQPAIAEYYESILPIIQQTWPTNDKPPTRDNLGTWLKKKIEEELDASKVAALTKSLQGVLQKEKQQDNANPEVSFGSGEVSHKLTSCKVWIKSQQSNLENLQEAIVPIVKSLWSDHKWMLDNSSWLQEFFAVVDMERNEQKLDTLVERLKTLMYDKELHEREKAGSLVDSEEKRQPTLEKRISDDIKWLQDSKKHLQFFYCNIKPLIKEQWPRTSKELIDDELFPINLVQRCKQQKTESIASFLTKIRSLVELLIQQYQPDESEGQNNVLEPEELPKKDCIRIELRVVISENSYTPRILQVWTSCGGYSKTYIMRLNIKRQCYVKSLDIGMMQGELIYRYYDYYQYNKWEILNSEWNVNRYCSFQEKEIRQTGKIVLYDIATFSRSHVDLIQLHRHLPYYMEFESSDVANELHFWTLAMKRGWYYNYGQMRVALTNAQVDKCLTKSIEHGFKLECDQEKTILFALSVLDSLTANGHRVQDAALVSKLLCLLSTEKLSEDQQKAVYRKVLNTLISSVTRPKADIPKSIINLLCELEFVPDVNFLFALPIYWIVVNGGDIKQSVVENNSPKYFVKRSCLPSSKWLKWNKIREKFSDEMKQRELKQLAPRILGVASIHPWITKAYEYLLSPTSIMELAKSKNNICAHFSVETIVDNVKRTRSTMRPEILSMWKQWIKGQFEKLKNLQQPWPSNAIDSGQVMDQILEILRLTSDMQKQTNRDNDLVIFAVEIASELSSLVLIASQKESLLPLRAEAVRDVMEFIRRRLEKCAVTSEQIDYWNRLFSITWTEDEYEKQWTDMLCIAMKDKIYMNWREKDEEFVRFCAAILLKMKFHAELDEIFRKKVDECFAALLLRLPKVESSWNFFNWFSALKSNESKESIMDLYDNFISRQVRSYPPLEFMLKWPHAPDFFATYRKKNFKGFSDDTKNILTDNIKAFSNIIDRMMRGNVKVEQLQLIIKNQEQCIALCKVLFEDQKRKMIDRVISKRKSQLMAYEEKRDCVGQFKISCSHLKQKNVVVRLNELVEKFDQDVCGIELSEIIDCSPDQQDNKVIFFENITSHMKELEEIASLKNNDIFLRHWLEEVISIKTGWQQDGGDEKILIDWEIVITDLWTPVRAKLVSFAEQICNGNAKLTLINEIFKGCDNDKTVCLMSELSNFYDLCNGVGNRILEQKTDIILQISQLRVSLDVGESLKLLKYAHGIEGHFEQLEHFPNPKERALTMNDAETLKFPEEFNDFSADDARILSSFVSQGELFSWLLKNTKKIDDVQVLCDLAMISAGENQMELDRVSALNSAVMGFSPLIFDMDKVKNLGDLIKRCWQVIHKCRNDDAILPNWISVGGNIQWITQTETFYGSVGKQSMSLVTEINEKGIYTIQRTVEKNLTSENSLTLKLVRNCTDENSENQSEMNLSDLHDLQSKLMLIAGEKESGHQVSRFVDLLNAIENLALIFVKLVNAGCMLFNHWKIEVANQPGYDDAQFLVKASFQKNVKSIGNRCSFDGIESVVNVMKDIHENWVKRMDSDRMKYYYLNEYNIHQIIYLCKTLANEGGNFPDQLYMLLSRVQQNPTFSDIKDLLSEATKATDSDDETDTGLSSDQTLPELNKVSLMKKMVRLLVNDEGVEEKIAKAAVKENGHEDKDECIDWILLNYDAKEKIDCLCLQFDNEIGFSHQGNLVQSHGSVVHDRSHRTIQEVMTILHDEAIKGEENSTSKAILTIYEKYTRSTASLTLQDFLSVKHLGIFLDSLGRLKNDKAKKCKYLNRSLPPPLTKRRPNLIICPEQEMLTYVLSLYMHKSDEPLPRSSEVLLCHENTTIDEVERFFRRGMCQCDSNGSPLFCLVYAHKLTHYVYEAAEKIFDSLSKADTNPNYQMAVFTSDQQHYLTTCFDQYSVDMKVLEPNNTNISHYLKNHLTVDKHANKKSAACVDSNSSSSVKVVYSRRSGVGKSLHIKRLKERLKTTLREKICHTTTVRYMQNVLDVDLFVDKVYQEGRNVLNADAHLIHIDLTPAVKKGVDRFTFDLLILGSVEDSHGRIWRRNFNHLYAVEVTEFEGLGVYSQSILPILPKVRCISPREELEKENKVENTIGMDDAELESDIFQRPLQYLRRCKTQQSLDDFVYDRKDRVTDKNLCINLYQTFCTIKDPSWAQLYYFSRFLNFQLENCEKSNFCNTDIVPELEGLKSFSIQFMIMVAQDFATPSLDISDESYTDADEAYLESYEKRRKWEENSHPYVFFNDDGTSMTFININIDGNGNLVNGKNEVVCGGLTTTGNLVQNLKAQGVPIGVDFDELTRKEKLKEICKFMGIPFTECSISRDLLTAVHSIINEDGEVELEDNQNVQIVSREDIHLLEAIKRQGSALLGAKFEQKERVLKTIADKMGIEFTQTSVPDPDPTYELTADNVLKIFAIYMRFRSGIPVIIMGETGCGKTRMIEFISSLKGTESNQDVDVLQKRESEVLGNMITLKVHGGVLVADIQKSIEKAKQQALRNSKYSHTILFYDEANTTEAIYAIKEVVCDKEVNGVSFIDSHLQIVAACNPYKKLSIKAVEKLESSGLGYRVRKAETKDKFGSIPMRTLVYRVVPLPPSMQPFVWDFGQLAAHTERIYIEQMTKKLQDRLNLTPTNQQMISSVLFDVQSYMRKEKDECRYVSLRDVERCMIAYEWFYSKREWLYQKITEARQIKFQQKRVVVGADVRSLIQVLGLCYHASLEDRESFREMLAKSLAPYHENNVGGNDILEEIKACQIAVVSDMKREKYVALNDALMENVYMMTLCVDMKIPLFLIGKPGSSKSMAKTLVSENMRGENSQGVLFRKLKQVQVVAFQCSALTHASGIIGVFKQCMQLQSNQKEESFAAAVVLDEIGLAEDSPNMPLKVLHPLLESGSTTYERLAVKNQSSKIAFVGISNWSLDPAKMNRGIFVTRNKPTAEDMEKTTEAIFSDQTKALVENRRTIDTLLRTYLAIYKDQENEYFGLRDFYSLMKMIKHSAMESGLTLQTVMDAVTRNFSGGKTSYTKRFFQSLKFFGEFKEKDYISLSVQLAIEKNLSFESRYLLLLANQYAAINLLQILLNRTKNMQVIFGSSFPGDKNYTEICRNINRIKICMETGHQVIILNLTEIHESLYDALNQHYVTFGKQKYVDLGLGEHRVKSKVHDDFRMIILENKDVVYDKYPTPLINRLEKHHFDSKSLLLHSQTEYAEKLCDWSKKFCSYDDQDVNFSCSDCFVGFHEDTISSVVLICDSMGNTTRESNYQNALLQTATMDSIFRLKKSHVQSKSEVQQFYLHGQKHDNLHQFLMEALKLSSSQVSLYEIISFSNILSEKDRKDLEHQLDLFENTVMLLSLHQFDTEQQYMRKLGEFFKRCRSSPMKNFVLLIQCSQAENHRQLISCARFGVTNILSQFSTETENNGKVIVAFLLSTGRKRYEQNEQGKRLLLQHTTDAEIVYVDELRANTQILGSPSSFFGLAMSDIFKKCVDGDKILDVSSLLKECVCEAVLKLKSGNERRNLERVAILNGMLDKETFAASILKRICDIYSARFEEEGESDDCSWSIQQACDVASLIEGGTFGKTLWLCLKRHAAKFLAYLLSIMDSNDNLDILKLKDESWEKSMWLSLMKQIPISWGDAMRKEEFEVANSCALSYYTFKTPFSYHLHQSFSEKLKEVTNVFDAKKRAQVFLRTVKDWKSVVAEACEQSDQNVIDNFISDVVHFIYTPTTKHAGDEVKGVVGVIHNFVKDKLKMLLPDKDEGCELPLVYLIVQDLSVYLDHIAKILSIFPDVMKNAKQWTQKARDSDEFCIHEFAFIDLIGELRRKSVGIADAKICREWHKSVSNTIDLYDKIQHSANNATKMTLWKEWEPISFLHLLLNSLLPEYEYKDYAEVIAKQANLLSKGCRKRALNSTTFVRLLCSTMSMCYEELKLKLILRWQDSICKGCSKRMSSPMALPCNHILCKICFETSMSSDNSTCPTCTERIPKETVPLPLFLSDEGRRKLNDFRRNCTSLLINFLKQFLNTSTAIGGDDSDDIKLLIVENFVIRLQQDGQLKTNAFDLNVNSRSLILDWLSLDDNKILENKIHQYLLKPDFGEEENTFVCAVLYHFVSSSEEIPWNEECFGEDFRAIQRCKIYDLQMWRLVARLRKRIQSLASLLWNQHGAKIDDVIERAAAQFLNNDQTETFRLFLVKCGCFTYGTEWFSKLKDGNQHRKAFIPTCLRETENLSIDHWRMLGTTYNKKLLEVVTMTNESILKIFENLIPLIHNNENSDSFIEILAILPWIMKEQNALNRAVELLAHSPLTSFAGILKSILQIFAECRAREMFPTQSLNNLIKLVIMAGGALMSSKNLLQDFYNFVKKPGDIDSLFLPSMPQSNYFTVPEEFRREKKNVLNEYWTDMYTCPNGHIYTIGDCTHPVWRGKCNECGAVIGGENYQPAPGNERFVIKEKSQAGYVLEETIPPRQNMDDPCERMTGQAVAVTRFMLHTCMLIAVHRDEQLISSFSAKEEKTSYLVHQLQKNLSDLSQSLAINKDDAIIVMNSIFMQMMKPLYKSDSAASASDEELSYQSESPEENSSLSSERDEESSDEDQALSDEERDIMNAANELSGQNASDGEVTSPSCDWSGVDARGRWEQAFRTQHLLPIFNHIDDIVRLAWDTINKSGNLCEMTLYRITRDMPLQIQSDEVWSKPMFWKVLQQPSLAHFTQAIRDNPGEHDILRLVLETPGLGIIKFLEDVLMVQKSFIAKYQYKVDLTEVDKKSFRQHLDEEQNRQETEELLERYFKAWKESEFSTKIDGCDREINMNSPISMALPSDRGYGKWAKRLTETYIEMQNAFLSRCAEKTTDMRFDEVSPGEVLHHHLVNIDRESGLTPLIRIHTNYYVTVDDDGGSQHRIVYNLNALEKQVRENFIYRKKMINIKEIACIQYPQDIGIGKDWQKLRDTIPQVPLNQKMKMNVDVAVSNLSQADVCEGVRVVAIAISFLSKVKAKSDRGLKDYLMKDLFLTDGHSTVVHKSIEVKHTLDLYQRLTWHKAVMFVQQGINPYKDVFAEGQQKDILENLQKVVRDAFVETNVKLLQQRINEILLKRPDYKVSWSLSKDLFPYIDDFLDENSENDSWYRKLPAEICYMHIAHLFKMSVEYLQAN